MLSEVIRRRIISDSTIISDCWKVCDTLKYDVYIHFSVNHSATFKDLETGAHTNTIEVLWSAINCSFCRTQRVMDQFDLCLAEYM